MIEYWSVNTCHLTHVVESYCTQEWATLASRPKTWVYIWTIMSHVWMHAPQKYIWTDVTGHKFHLSLDLHVYVHMYMITNMYVLSLYKDTQVWRKYNTRSSMGCWFNIIKKQKWICIDEYITLLYSMCVSGSSDTCAWFLVTCVQESCHTHARDHKCILTCI